jgi:hypothetical protein
MVGRAVYGRRAPSPGPGIAVLAAACGGGSSPGGTRADPMAQVLAYSKCMRAHGVTNFPDPVADRMGNVSVSGAGIDMNSPQVQAADQACRSLVPGSGGGSPSH